MLDFFTTNLLMSELLNVRVPAKVRATNKARIDQGLCIIAGCPNCIYSRGLCLSHKNKFDNRKRRIAVQKGRAKAIEWERTQIRLGFAIGNQEIRQYKEKPNLAG